MLPFALTYLGLVIVASVASFAAYGLDKRRAATGGRRVPEQTLHLVDFLGGWPGGLAARRHFRHKTRKLSFRVAFWLIVSLHLLAAGAVAYAVAG